MLKISTTHGSTFTIDEHDNAFNIECNIKLINNNIVVYKALVKQSKLLTSWIKGYTPHIYRSIYGKQITIGNIVTLDLENNIWWDKYYPNIRRDLNSKVLRNILESLHIPVEYVKDLPISIESTDLDLLKQEFEKFPRSVDVSNWYFLDIKRAIVLMEIPKILFHVNAKLDSIKVPSEAYMEFSLRQFASRECQYCNTPIKQHMTKRKVKMPLQAPEKLENNWVLVLTSTPQSEKAGLIAELASGVELDDYGRVTKVPERVMSIASKICPFPQRMAANREVVLQALSQAMCLVEPEPPIIGSCEIDTVNLLVVRMKHPLTHNDGCIISEQAAMRMLAYKKVKEQFYINKTAKCLVEAMGSPIELIAKNFKMLIKSNMKFVNTGAIAIDEKVVISKNRGIVTKVERYEFSEDKDILNIETLRIAPIEIGAKVMDRHSNKGTISAIWSNKRMPVVRIGDTFRKVDAIVTPYLGKRILPSRQMEEIESIKTLFPDTLFQDTLFPVVGIEENILGTVPCGIISYAVLDHYPSDKIKYSNKINTSNGRTMRGLRNYTWTDAMFTFMEHGCSGIIKEIQSYNNDSENAFILYENLKAIGLKFEGKIKISEEGILKSQTIENIPIVSKGIITTIKRTQDNIKGTIYEHDKTSIYIKIPSGFPLFIEELSKSIGCLSKHPSSVYSYLVNNKEKLIKSGIPFDHIYSNGLKERYIYIPSTHVKNYIDHLGHVYPSRIMDLINRFLLTIEKIKESAAEIKEKRIISANMQFNDIISCIIHDTITKNGMLRECISPRTAFSTYAVVSNHGKDYDSIYFPYKVVMEFAKNENFRKFYELPEEPTPKDIIRCLEDKRILVMRQPCHSRRDVSSFKLKFWWNKTIGISSAAWDIASGDFDGDCAFAQMFLTDEAYQDLEKLKIENIAHLMEKKKDLCHLKDDFSVSAVREALDESIGETEVLLPEQAKTFLEFSKLRNDYITLQAKAAQEFLYIKTGTANAGGIGNAIRHLFYHLKGEKGVGIANQIYHKLAQAALDSKSSSTNAQRLSNLLTSLREIRDPGKTRLEKQLVEFLNKEETKEFLNILYINEKWNGGVSVMAAYQTPFSRLLYRGHLGYAYRSTITNENSVATKLAEF